MAATLTVLNEIIRSPNRTDTLPAVVPIADDVWIGGGAIICPGVQVGPGSTIGSGRSVTSDIPARVFAQAIRAESSESCSAARRQRPYALLLNDSFILASSIKLYDASDKFRTFSS